MTHSTEIENVPRITFFWIIGGLVSINLIFMSGMYTSITKEINNVNERLSTVQVSLDRRVTSNENDIDDIDEKLTEILVGIQDLKTAQGLSQ